MSVDFPQVIGDEIVLRVTEDPDADTVTVGGLSAEACYHPYGTYCNVICEGAVL